MHIEVKHLILIVHAIESDSSTNGAESLQNSEISHTDYCDSLKEFLWVFL